MTKKFLGWIALGGAWVLSGCGGSTSASSVVTQAPSYYAGTVQINSIGSIPAGTAPIVTTDQPTGNMSLYFWDPAFSGSIGKSGSLGALVEAATRELGTMNVTPGNNSFSFSLVQNVTTIATATLSLQPGPALSHNVSVPPSGTYSGKLLVYNQVGICDFGSATGTIDSNGRWNAKGYTMGFWLGEGTFSGLFTPVGSLTDLTLSTYLTTTSSSPAPYSFDGKQIVIRLDNILLKPGTGWLILTKQ